MDNIRQYLISVICACVIASILTSLCGKQCVSSGLLKLIFGVFITFTLIGPIVRVEFQDLHSFYTGISCDAASIVSEGKIMAQETTQAIIKEQLEAYILDKASSLGLDVKVSLSLNNAEVPTPDEVTISGSASPYGKKMLQDYLTQQLGIAEEKQIWR